jgi:PTS system cellobiose-specific IIB component
MKILVVCGAGASSTFVALKVRTAAKAAGLDATVAAGSISQLDLADDVDVVLVGAHLTDALPALRERAAASGVAVAVLPAVSPASIDADAALGLALDAKAAAL